MLDLSERCPSCWLPSRALVSRRVDCGWPVVVCGWPEVVCGWPEVVYGWPEVVYGWKGDPTGGPHGEDLTGETPRGGPHGKGRLRMAGVVYGWKGDPTGGPHGGDHTGVDPTGGTPQERTSADGRGRLRMACPRFTVPDGRRGKMGWIRVLCALAGFRPLWSAARPWSCGSSVV